MFNSGLNTLAPVSSKTGLLASLKKINFANILNTTQKTLNIVNQAIPLVYQVKPIVSNAKTIFKIMGAVKNDNNTTRNNNSYINNSNTNTANNMNQNNRNEQIKSLEYQKSTINTYNTNINKPNFFI